MNYESKIDRENLSPVEIETGIFNIFTSGETETTYSDVLAAGREIGRQRIWGWTKTLVGGGTLLIASMVNVGFSGALLFDKIKASQLDPLGMGMLAGVAIGAWYTAKNGLGDINLADSRDIAIKDSFELSGKPSEEQIQSPYEPTLEVN